MTDFIVGPWKGVRDLLDPYGVPKQYLTRARNIYMPDLPAPSSVYGRPGFALKNPSIPLADAGDGRVGQAVAFATLEDGTTVNFLVCGGRLYRCSAGFLTREDVTPDELTIDPEARVYLTPFSNRLVITDGVHTPGVLDDLNGTVTFEEIDYDGSGTAWKAYGPATVWEGSLFFIVRQVGAENRTVRHAWSQPDDPFTGDKQEGVGIGGNDAYDNEWDMVQNGMSPLMGMVGSNLALYYFRDGAIGYLTGAVNDLRTTATHDAIDEAEGTRAPASFVTYGNAIYFVDVAGKPFRIAGGKLTDLSKQFRRQVTRERTRWPDVTARTACAVLVPEHDVVLFAIWSPDPENATLQYPTVLYAFHADTGTYIGEWTIEHVAIHAMGTHIGINGEPQLVILGHKIARDEGDQVATDGGYIWVLSAVDEEVWKDNGNVPEIFATSNRVGFSPLKNLNTDQCVAIVGAVTETEPDLVPVSIEILPEESNIEPGEIVELTAIVKNARGQILDMQPDVWISDNPTGVSVDGAGVAEGLQAGVTANITAELTYNGTTITSNQAVVNVAGDTTPATIEVTPEEMELYPTQTGGVTAVVKNADGFVIPDAVVVWHTSDAAKATVASTGDLTGTVTGVDDAGTCNIYATSDAATSNNCVVTCIEDVSTVPATIEVTPTSMSLEAGQVGEVTAVVKNIFGDVILGSEVVWHTSDAAKATVASTGDLTGDVTGVAGSGTCNIYATCGPATSNNCVVTCIEDTVLIFVNDNEEQVINYPTPKQLAKFYWLRVNSGSGLVQALIVGAGGGGAGVFGSGVAGGGGGGGGVIGRDGNEFWFDVEPGDYLVEVGGRGREGSSGASLADGINGGDSEIFGERTEGGGGGACVNNLGLGNNRNGWAGGSGGGAGQVVGAGTHTGGAGTAGQGEDGAGTTDAGSSAGLIGGGGGGAAEDATDKNGGDGAISSITGVATRYGGGGGGGNGDGSAVGVGAGGLGGGGTPGSSPHGTDSLGGGGGASRRQGGATSPGRGGSGVVIVRIPVESGIDAEIVDYP
jgi:hypothetical protein